MRGISDYLNSVRFVVSYAARFVPSLSLVLVFMFMVTGLVPYANSFVLGKLVDNIVSSVGTGVSGGMITLLVLYAAFNTLPHLLSNARRYILRHWRLLASREIELDILQRREAIDIAHLENPKFQDLIQRAFRNGYGPIHALTEGQFNLVWDLTSFIVGTFLAVHFSPLVYVVVMISAVPGFIIDIKFASRGWSIWAKDSPDQRRFADLRHHFMNKNMLIENKMLQSGRKFLDWMRQILTDFSHKQLKNEKTRFWGATLSDALAFAGFSLGLFLVVRDVASGQYEVGTVVYMLGVLSSVRGSFNDILSGVSTHYEDALIVKDIELVLKTEAFIKESPEPKRLDLLKAPEIVFENVGFKYPSSEFWSLRHINLTLKPGDKVGLVGNNGAGKTTFVKLLCRIYDPVEGRILVNGIDLRDVSTQEWWSYLGVMFQDYASYDFLVKEAIAVGRPEKPLDLEKVKSSAEMSQSSSFIEEWAHKYNHQLGVEFSGAEPSKGQKQKLSIAKILYREAYLMILDEPTASVDAESEARIFESLESLSKNMTAILISHDFSTISECDQIFVLEKGLLSEAGSHKELMKKKGKYAELYNLQAERFKK